MPDLEIDSPLDSATMAPSFPVRGHSDLAAGTKVTVTVTGGGITGSPGGPYNAFTLADGSWEVASMVGAGTKYKVEAAAAGAGSDNVDQIEVLAAPPNIIISLIVPMATTRTTVTVTGNALLVNNTGADTDVFVLVHVFRGKKKRKTFSAKSAGLTDKGDGTADWTETLPVPNDTDRIVVEALRINHNTGRVLDRTSRKA